MGSVRGHADRLLLANLPALATCGGKAFHKYFIRLCSSCHPCHYFNKSRKEKAFRGLFGVIRDFFKSGGKGGKPPRS